MKHQSKPEVFDEPGFFPQAHTLHPASHLIPPPTPALRRFLYQHGHSVADCAPVLWELKPKGKKTESLKMYTHIFHWFIRQVIGECVLYPRCSVTSQYNMASYFVGYTYSLVTLVPLKGRQIIQTPLGEDATFSFYR